MEEHCPKCDKDISGTPTHVRERKIEKPGGSYYIEVDKIRVCPHCGQHLLRCFETPTHMSLFQRSLHEDT